ncbi:MAG: apolipoprotein acyltransferase [Boseongicola sp.]|nr:apolipoprotein acyltransferase [Boseongicola sp.]MDD9978326.1 apolipoprotein acyltransferase [Boseongicola sp.]
MIAFIFAIVGAALGARTAHRRKGTRLDMLQYAAGYGIAFGLIGLFVGIIIARMTL